MKKLFTALTLFVMLILVSGISYAGQQAAKTRTTTGYSHVMCDAESSTGVCDTNETADVYAIVDLYDKVTFTLLDAGDSTSVCEIYAGTVSDSALEGVDDIEAFGGDKVNSVDLSNTQEKISYSDIGYKYMWIKCTTADASSKVIMQGSVGRKR